MTGHANLLYLRVFGANPWRGDDGLWHALEGRIDMSIGVPKGYQQKVLDILEQGLDIRINTSTVRDYTETVYSVAHSIERQRLMHYLYRDSILQVTTISNSKRAKRTVN